MSVTVKTVSRTSGPFGGQESTVTHRDGLSFEIDPDRSLWVFGHSRRVVAVHAEGTWLHASHDTEKAPTA